MRDGLGTPEYLINSTLTAIGEPAEAAHERETLRQMIGDLSPAATHAITRADRESARQEITKFERMMREAPQEYWKLENQQAYRSALERSLIEAPTMPATEAPPAAAPAPSAPAPAPSGEGQASATAA